MTSLDTNLLFYSLNENSPDHERAREFVNAHMSSSDFVISELVLVELYGLLRNAIILTRPLSSGAAAQIIHSYRQHPHWILAGFPGGSSESVHDRLWEIAARPGFAYRRIYDARLALALQYFRVTDFATANVKDFEGFGFRRVWNPLTE